jgi:hypothetical protein
MDGESLAVRSSSLLALGSARRSGHDGCRAGQRRDRPHNGRKVRWRSMASHRASRFHYNAYKMAEGCVNSLGDGLQLSDALACDPVLGKKASRRGAASRRPRRSSTPRGPSRARGDRVGSGTQGRQPPLNVPRKHQPGAGRRYNNFEHACIDADSVVREALRAPNAVFRPNASGGFRVDTDLGRVIGQGGRRSVRVIVSQDGRVITAYPYGSRAP